MVFSNEKWIAAYKQAASDLPTCGPADGVVCVLASIRYIRSGLEEDAKATPAKGVRESMAELWNTAKTAKLGGFACNASAAAKAAKLAVDSEKSVDVEA